MEEEEVLWAASTAGFPLGSEDDRVRPSESDDRAGGYLLSMRVMAG